jgi:hypothetical protein
VNVLEVEHFEPRAFDGRDKRGCDVVDANPTVLMT